MSEVLLRPWKKEDAQALAAIANNRTIWNQVRDRMPSPYTVTDALEWIEHCSKQKPLQNFCIEVNGAVTGSIGFIPKADVCRKTVEIGYFVGELYWGKGIATTAVALLLQHIENTLDVVRIYAEVFEHNKASMQVLRKNGFSLEGIRRKAVIKNNIIMDDYVWVKLL
ncbi:MAG: GNAT family N-acetyltransferase [Bacteroidota bacterium]|nr:GNAT family N-acetyltransferase [Bacteroidota bacterium]